MAHDSTTDAWMNAPLDHGGQRVRSFARRKPNRLTAVCAVGALIAIAALAVVVAFFGWRGSYIDLPWRGTPQTRATPGEQQAPELPRPRATEQGAPAPQGERTTRITKCISVTGTPTTFSDGPCPPGTRGNVVVVRPDLNLADGMSPAQRSDSMRDNRLKAQATAEYEQRSAAQSNSSSSVCAQLEAEIASLDAAARQPRSAWEQDRIREQRKRARDQQFALRCA